MRSTIVALRSPDDQATLDRVWATSQDSDDRGFRPRDGWWSLSAWAERASLLHAGDEPVGGLAVRRAPDGALEGRLALLPRYRTQEAARRLVAAARDAAEAVGSSLLRLTVPASATWARSAAAAAGLRVARATLVMIRPATLGPLPAAGVASIAIWPLSPGEEGRLLDALNHAWAGTWNFRPLTRRALEHDLAGQCKGFLVATDPAGRIAGTAHAQFHPTGRNPDGAAYAWIANLTTGPEWRGRGLGRALLSAAISQLHERGAGSVALGVDSGAVAPIALYRSAGFTEIDRLELWESRRAVAASSLGLRGIQEGAQV